MRSISYSPVALEELKSLPPEASRDILSYIKMVAVNPYHYVRRLPGYSRFPLYTLRAGEYRIVLYIEKESMIVFAIESRT